MINNEICSLWKGIEIILSFLRLHSRTARLLTMTPAPFFSEGFLPTVGDMMVIELNLPILVHFSSLIPKMSMLLLPPLFYHFQFTLIHVPEKLEKTEWYCEDIQDLLELTPKKDIFFIIGDWNAKVGSQEIPGVTSKFDLGVQNETGQRLIEFCQENALVIASTLFNKTKDDSPHGHHQMVNTEIRLIIFFAVIKGEVLHSQQKQDQELTGLDHEVFTAKFRLKLKKLGKTTRPFGYDLNQITYDYTLEVTNRFKGLDLIDRVSLKTMNRGS